MKNILVAMVVCWGLVACSGDDDNSGGSEYDGTYALTATATTQTANDGGACAEGASGTLIITNSSISGSAVDSNGETYSLNGSVSSSGNISGGFALSGEDAVAFDGVISGSSGSGDYLDIYACAGTWTAARQ